MKRLRLSLFLLFLATVAIQAQETTAAPSTPVAGAETSPAAKKRELEFALTTGFISIAGKDDIIKNNRGAEIGLITTLPLTLWREDANLIAVRGQFTSYANGIEVPSNFDPTTIVKLTNAGHSQVRADYRQIFTYWDIQWSFGLGVQIPVTSSIMTPRGELNFNDAKAYYASAVDSLNKIDSSYAGYFRFGIDQKILQNLLILGVALELSFAESPKTQQKLMLNFYAGARLW